MKNVRGVVMEVGRRTVVVYTEEGAFREIRTPKRDVRVGEPIDVVDRPAFSFTYRMAVAAALLLVLLGSMAWPWAGLRSAVASQVIVDSDGTIQLSVDKSNRVIKVTPLNEKARPWVKKLRLEGRDVYEAVGLIARNMVNPARGGNHTNENVVMVSVADHRKSAPTSVSVNEDKVRDTLHAALSEKDYEGYLVVNQVDSTTEEQAQRMQISPNRYLMLRSLRNRGISLDVRQVREADLGEVIQHGQVPMERVFNRGCWFMRRPYVSAPAPVRSEPSSKATLKAPTPTSEPSGSLAPQQSEVPQPSSNPDPYQGPTGWGMRNPSSWSCGPWQQRWGAPAPQPGSEATPAIPQISQSE